jgi:beta-N-acetylhexosaminidase
MVMTSHIKFKNIDPNPVTFSDFFLKKIIREELKYRGLIVSDDLGMKALASHYKMDEIPVKALNAGVDVLLYCNEPEAPPVAMEALIEAVAQGVLNKTDLEISQKRIQDLKKVKLLVPDPKPIEQAMEVIGHEEHQYLADCIRKQVIPEGLGSAES